MRPSRSESAKTGASPIRMSIHTSESKSVEAARSENTASGPAASAAPGVAGASGPAGSSCAGVPGPVGSLGLRVSLVRREREREQVVVVVPLVLVLLGRCCFGRMDGRGVRRGEQRQGIEEQIS